MPVLRDLCRKIVKRVVDYCAIKYFPASLRVLLFITKRFSFWTYLVKWFVVITNYKIYYVFAI